MTKASRKKTLADRVEPRHRRKPRAEALSGLARAFFYAGARALFVSHGRVESRAATQLTISTFEALRADPSLGRAEALRRAILACLSDPANPVNAFPTFGRRS
jgi:CHAT domain-containing protein